MAISAEDVNQLDLISGMETSKIISVDRLYPLNLRPIVDYRVNALKTSIVKHGYDLSCPLIVQKNCDGFNVVNGCHMLRAAIELNIQHLPVLEFPDEEDPASLAMRTQDANESVQPWDFLDRAYLVKQLYQKLGTREEVAKHLGWAESNISYYKAIAELPDMCVTLIRDTVTMSHDEAVTDERHDRDVKNLDNIWKATWFRHICSLPTDDLKIAIVKKIAESPLKYKEKEVSSECSRIKKRFVAIGEIKSLIDDDLDKEILSKLEELLDAVNRGAYDKEPEVAVERAQAIIKAGRRTDIELMDEWDSSPLPYDVWKFNKRDDRFGKSYPGNIPAGILFNVLYFFSEQGDLVADPMAGGGVTGDVCAAMKRKSLMFDVNPSRDDIKKWNLEKGWPEEANNCDLVFIDPPYYKKKAVEYGQDSVSAYDKGKYLQFFKKMAVDMRKSGVKKVAFLMSDYNDEKEPSENIFIWDYVSLFDKAGYMPLRHIMVPLTEQSVHPDIVNKFRKGKRLARLGRSLVIFIAI
jgi:DNA modification methylase